MQAAGDRQIATGRNREGGMDDPDAVCAGVCWRIAEANFFGVRGVSGPLPFWLRDTFLYLASSYENENVENSSVTVKICIIDEAASEAVAAWECMDNKPIDETRSEEHTSELQS